jgi:aminopeptidase N
VHGGERPTIRPVQNDPVIGAHPLLRVPGGHAGRVRRAPCAAVLAAAFLLCAAVPPEPASAASSSALLGSISQSCTLTATLDVERGTVAAVERLAIRNRSRSPIDALDLSVLPRAIGAYRADGPVTVAGRRATTRWTTGTNLRVTVRPALAPGRSTTVTIPFRLTLTDGEGSFGARMGRSGGVLHLGDWFPVLSTVHDAHGVGDPQVTWAADRIRLELTLPDSVDPDQVAASGERVDWDQARHRLVVEIRHARNAAVAVSPAYLVTEHDVDGTRVRILTLGDAGEAVMDHVAAALRRYADWYGPYPFPTLDVAETGVAEFGQEYPGLVFLGRDVLGSPFGIWHEIAHEWWYALVGNDQIREPWVDEAVATFSSLHALGIPPVTCSTLPVDLPITAWPAEPTTGDWAGCDGYAETVYLRGAVFLDAVRATMGTDLFFGTLRAFVAAHRWQVVGGRDLVDAFRSADIATDAVIREFTSYR